MEFVSAASELDNLESLTITDSTTAKLAHHKTQHHTSSRTVGITYNIYFTCIPGLIHYLQLLAWPINTYTTCS